MKDYFLELSDHILDSFGLKNRIEFGFNMEEIELDVDTAIPLGLIVNELITNSLKHAFNNKVGGKIILRLRMLECGKYQMIIGDNGTGGIVLDKNGMGTKLINIFTKQLNGDIERLETEGWQYKITFECIDNINI